MLLRRITHHVKTQNWFAVGIDFAIVVVGVFIGLQVANWNASRADRAKGDDLVARLAVEAATTRAELTEYRKVHQGISTQATQLAIELDNRTTCLEARDNLKVLIVSLADFPPPRFSLSTARQALETGNVALIRSPQTQIAIQDISNELTFLDRQWQRYVSIKQYANDETHKAAGIALSVDSTLRINPMASNYDADDFRVTTPDRICGNPEILALVSNTAVTQSIYVGYLEQVEQAMESYIAKLTADTAQ